MLDYLIMSHKYWVPIHFVLSSCLLCFILATFYCYVIKFTDFSPCNGYSSVHPIPWKFCSDFVFFLSSLSIWFFYIVYISSFFLCLANYIRCHISQVLCCWVLDFVLFPLNILDFVLESSSVNHEPIWSFWSLIYLFIF